MPFGINSALRALAVSSNRERHNPDVYVTARQITDGGSGPDEKIRLLVDELHRRFAYAPNPVSELVPALALNGSYMDVDEGCLFVATLAVSVGIRCRLIGARYGKSWTCLVGYETAGEWKHVDVLRQVATNRDPDELVIGQVLEPTLTSSDHISRRLRAESTDPAVTLDLLREAAQRIDVLELLAKKRLLPSKRFPAFAHPSPKGMTRERWHYLRSHLQDPFPEWAVELDFLFVEVTRLRTSNATNEEVVQKLTAQRNALAGALETSAEIVRELQRELATT